MSFLDRFFGPSYDKELKQIRPIVEEINNKESFYSEFTNEALVEKTLELKGLLANGSSTDDILTDAFALVREGASVLWEFVIMMYK